jgi:predicted nucleic acid-binding protein
MTEVTNAIWKQFIRGRASLADCHRMLDFLFQVPVQVAPTGPLLRAALDLAAKYRCAVYDALFVALVAQRGVGGVTADEPLYLAVRADFPSIRLLRHW